jgi:beta-lactamase regulating signal transducer with metallopeptidase domain
MGFLLTVSLRSLLLAAAAGAALAIGRVKSPAVRHAVWTLVTISMLAIAIVSATLPDVPVRVLQPAHTLHQPSPSPATLLKAPLHIPTRPSPWALVYAAGFLALAARLAFGYVLARRLVRAAVPLVHLDRVFESAQIAVPLNIGRRVILPVAWRTWDAAKLDAVLIHERTHVRRADWAIAALAAVNRCIFWFHPLAWWLEARLRTLAEEACDDASLAQTASRKIYAQTLIDMAAALRGTNHRVAWHALAMAKGADVRMRIERILDDSRPLFPPLTRARWTALALFAVPIIYLTGVARPARVAAQQPQPAARYYVQGEVSQPGEYKLTVPTRVLKALVDAHGFRDAADTSDILILRDGARLHFNYQEVSHNRNLEQNILLRPGDIIIVR